MKTKTAEIEYIDMFMGRKPYGEDKEVMAVLTFDEGDTRELQLMLPKYVGSDTPSWVLEQFEKAARTFERDMDTTLELIRFRREGAIPRTEVD